MEQRNKAGYEIAAWRFKKSCSEIKSTRYISRFHLIPSWDSDGKWSASWISWTGCNMSASVIHRRTAVCVGPVEVIQVRQSETG